MFYSIDVFIGCFIIELFSEITDLDPDEADSCQSRSFFHFGRLILRANMYV